MIRRATSFVMSVIPLAVAACNLASAQQPPATTLTIDLRDMIEYQEDIYDPVKSARSPNVTPSLGIGAGVANFAVATLLGDIVAVNGQPAKGLYAGRSRTIIARTNPTPGQAIADVTRAAIREPPVGSIMLMGLSGGNSPPPGQPSTKTRTGRSWEARGPFWARAARQKPSSGLDSEGAPRP